ncbi:hypothetical protein T07_12470 [Trichinella nelsoni]|uniref:Uncharacterized protein n=1 Tax=Trichinella nelsoni TaxID=6336 RepID=A0A0V0RHF0_9BILA|nr:hypothetical protein T07_12470 [Trichinella nelsoni]
MLNFYKFHADALSILTTIAEFLILNLQKYSDKVSAFCYNLQIFIAKQQIEDKSIYICTDMTLI